MTTIYLLRHGEAEIGRGTDANRRLTPSGTDSVARTAERYQAITSSGKFEPFQVLVSSPLLRAKQTASRLAEQLDWQGDIEIWPELAPAGKIPELEARLTSPQDDSSVDTWMLVTHQPLVSELIHYLTGDVHYMDTAWMAVLEGEFFAGELCNLKELITP